MTRQRILITNGRSDASLAAIRSLANAGYEIHSADVVDMPFGLKSRYARSHHVLDNSTPAAYEAALLELVERLRPDVLLPIGTRAVSASVNANHRLQSLTSLNVPSTEALSVANDKVRCTESCETLGVPIATVYSEGEALEILSEARNAATLVVKPATNIGAARGVTYVRTAGELERALTECRTEFGRVMIQDFVPGDATAMKTVVVLYSHASRLVAAFTTRKRRQWPTSGGLTVVSESTRDQALVDLVRPFFDHWQWRGPAEVELKHDSRTGVDRVIEINGRFPAYLRFPAACGLDLATMAARLALRQKEQPMEYPAYEVGVKYMNPGLLMKSAAWHLRRAEVSELGSVLADFGSGISFAIDMLRDPFPFLGRAVGDLKSAISSPRPRSSPQ